MSMVEKHIGSATYLTSGGAIMFGLSASDLAALVGTVVAVLTFAVNWYYKWKADRREQERCKRE